MDFELTSDQHDLQEVVRDVVDQECPASLVRAVAEGTVGDEVDTLWKTFVGLDWPTLTIPEADGGMGATAVELVITTEELGRVADPTPFIATTSQYAAVVRETFAAEPRAELLGEVCAGTTGAAAFEAPEVSVERDGDGWRLSGRVENVIDADRAERIAVVASTDEGPGVFVVPGAEVSTERRPTFDSTLHLGHVTLDGVTVSPDRSAVGSAVAEGVGRARQEAVTCLAASMVGASQRILEMTLDHVKERHQFGVPIGSFQAVKHMAVEVYMQIEKARALCHFAALTMAEDDPRRALAVSMAKTAAGDCQRIAAAHGIQLFGGLGYTWENDLQLFVRRAKSGEPLLGSTAEHRAEVARLYRPSVDEEAVAQLTADVTEDVR